MICFLMPISGTAKDPKEAIKLYERLANQTRAVEAKTRAEATLRRLRQ
jgi:hypothetical protein